MLFSELCHILLIVQYSSSSCSHALHFLHPQILCLPLQLSFALLFWPPSLMSPLPLLHHAPHASLASRRYSIDRACRLPESYAPPESMPSHPANAIPLHHCSIWLPSLLFERRVLRLSAHSLLGTQPVFFGLWLRLQSALSSQAPVIAN